MFFSFKPVGLAKTVVTKITIQGVNQGLIQKIQSRFLTQENSVYDTDKVSQDIRNLYQTGLFDQVLVQSKRYKRGIHLIFTLEQKRILGLISFKGNDKVKDNELNAVLTLIQGQVFSQADINASVQAVYELYQEEGLFLAEVDYEVLPYDTEKGLYEIVFNIRENKKAKIRRIKFVGNKAFSDKELSKKIRSKVKGFLSFITQAGKYKKGQLFQDAQLLEYHYRDQGYLDIKVGQPKLYFTRNRKAIYLTFPVTEGKPYKVSQVEVLGDILTTQAELKEKFKMKEKETFRQSFLYEDMDMLKSHYGDRAYFFANIYPQIIPDPQTHTAKVIYTVQKGPKVYIERIDISGNTTTRDKVIRREVQLKEAAPYSETARKLSLRRLMQLGYFESVDISFPRGSRENTVIAKIEVVEKPFRNFSIGAAYSTLEGFGVRGSVAFNNFLGYGIGLNFAGDVSKVRQLFQFSMTDRYFLDTNWIFQASLYHYNSGLNRSFDERTIGGSISLGREVLPFFDVIVGYQIEKAMIDDFSILVPDLFRQNASGLTSSALLTLRYDNRDNRAITSKGMYHSVTGTYAGSGLGGDNDYFKVVADARFYFRLPLKSVFKFRGRFRYVDSLNDDVLPLYERLFLGGVYSLRGFDVGQVGPQVRLPASATGGDQIFVQGGNRDLLFNAELELPIYNPIGLKAVAFFDAGQAYAENEDISFSKIRTNYGFGLRWNSPMGPLRFEWGFPIDKKAGESGSVFNFSIGQSF